MYYEIVGRTVGLSEGKEALIHEKLSLLEHLLQDYPPESVMSRVTLDRLPMHDEYYSVRVNLELPGDKLFAQADGITLENALVAVTGELERQLQRLLSAKRNEGHWKRLRRSPETVRRTVPVDEDELADIEGEVRQRTEQQQAEEESRQHPAA